MTVGGTSWKHIWFGRKQKRAAATVIYVVLMGSSLQWWVWDALAHWNGPRRTHNSPAGFTERSSCLSMEAFNEIKCTVAITCCCHLCSCGTQRATTNTLSGQLNKFFLYWATNLPSSIPVLLMVVMSSMVPELSNHTLALGLTLATGLQEIYSFPYCWTHWFILWKEKTG